MPNQGPAGTLPAPPEHPNLRHLKDFTGPSDLLKADQAESLAKAQLQISAPLRLCQLAPAPRSMWSHWKKLGKLKHAIDTNDLGEVQRLMTRNPALHRAPLGYGKDGPLTWVAGVPRLPAGAAGCDAPGHGAMDDRARLRRASGRRRPADARRARWPADPDDGTSGAPRRGCECRMARAFS